MAWRLGLDIGTNSIGWAALSLQGPHDRRRPTDLLSAGVRIFSDGRNPKDRQSNAVARRLPRHQRRMRDRYVKRRGRFMEALIRHGLMPTAVEARKALQREDPWVLRVNGLDEKLTPHQLGRALFHLQQRRGFKSNRKTDRANDDERGKIRTAAAALKLKMQETGARTFGEYLARPRVKEGSLDHKAASTNPVRARLQGTGAKATYDFYPTREMVEDEFHCLWDSQKRFDEGTLTDTARDALCDILFFQRKLKPQPVGKCSLNPMEERAPRALPSVQRLRIYQEINHLRVRAPGEAERRLTREERDALVDKALAVRKLTFDSARKALKALPGTIFNLESETRKHLDGDQTAAVLAARTRWGPMWRKLPLADQERVIETLLTEENESDLRDWLLNQYGLAAEKADAVMTAHLPDGHAHLGRTATINVLEELGRDVVNYDEAVRAAGFDDHSALDFDGEILDVLPYYGKILQRHVAFGSGKPSDIAEKRYGKIANPTVHVALNQLRRLVNELMARFGRPEEIVVELARDLPLSAKGKANLDRVQRENRHANDERRDTLSNLGQADSYENRLRLRLWEELNPANPLDRRCPYTGEQISLTRLFSDQVEIEHILPFSRTLDNGVGNKTLSMRVANRLKGQRSPYEAFADSPAGCDWEAISARAANMPANKSWRFGPDAMDRYNNEERDFLDRQLVDTRYMSRIARHYLMCTGADVWVTPGRLTSDLRWVWGLDSVLSTSGQGETTIPAKNRLDHRHHAVDAVVVALTDRRILADAATRAGKAEERFDKRYLADLPKPWPDFHDTVRECMNRIIVSHKPDHGVQGALHNDTAYGVVEEPDANGRSIVVHRVPLSRLKPGQLGHIRDPLIRDQLRAATTGLSGAAFTRALMQAGEAMNPPVRRVRLCERLRVIPTVSTPDGRILKAYKGDSNYCYDIFRNKIGQWSGHVVTRFDANLKTFNAQARLLPDGTPLVMRLRVDDMLAIDGGEESRIMRVVKLSPGRITLADHFEAGSLKARTADKNDRFSYLTKSPGSLKDLGARKVRVTVSGKLFDPGPPT